MDENTVVELANYIKQLQDLNNNYKAQIENLKAQISNLEKQILNLEQQVKTLEEENNKLQKELEVEKTKKLVWTVVATIAIGSTIYLFVK
jgi:phage shock protein A